MTIRPDDERPVDVEGVPAEEDISVADAAERIDLDPEDQPLRRDPVQSEGPASDSDT